MESEETEREARDAAMKDAESGASLSVIVAKLKASRTTIDAQFGAWLIAIEAEWKTSCAVRRTL